MDCVTSIFAVCCPLRRVLNDIHTTDKGLKNYGKVESFQLDHTVVKAPYVRAAGLEHDEKGSTVQKYDLRFLQPNKDAIPAAALHTLEYLIATYMRDEIQGIIDISSMG